MLDTDTKRRIDSCRDILVGKVPDPKSQVEQITIALIYKFMDDMDAQSEEFGGKRSFFVNGFEKYSWSKLLAPSMGGQDTLNLYSEAIGKMTENTHLPALFRDIFKNAYLPYRDPETLKAFLKEIDGFSYDHSERLGDAFEYLLSVLGSQGDAGQFRTPRHIIDFIVRVINPKKHERILDPACGTAGFLISAWKHILAQNQEHKPGDKLTPDERNKLAANIHGYDISPDMVRLSLVNLYLHGFTDPHVEEYDTLTSEDKWNEHADVILANPPFMSPKGGIKPHKRFSIQATRSEVLFVDYIHEHLSPNGRAGIIVPEGIIFQQGNAYKALRKLLVQNSLVAVVSLPAGVFQPYSGVKTSILIFDKRLAKQTDKILFLKVSNDGFSLSAQRRPVTDSELPEAEQALSQFFSRPDDFENNALAQVVSKTRIAESGDWNLGGDRYIRVKQRIGTYPHVALGDLCSYVRGVTYTKSDEVSEGGVAVLRANNIDLRSNQLDLSDLKRVIPAENFSESQRLKAGDILICAASGSADHVGKVAYSKDDTDLYFGGFMAALRANEKILPQYLFSCLKTSNFRTHLTKSIAGANINNLKASIVYSFSIPLPPIEIQREIVAEIDGYQKIIDGARQVVDNYQPRIVVNSAWPRVRIGDLFSTKSGTTPRRNNSAYFSGGHIPWVKTLDLNDGPIYGTDERVTDLALAETHLELLPKGTVLIAMYGGFNQIGRTGVLEIEAVHNQAMTALLPTNEVDPYYLNAVFISFREHWKAVANSTRKDPNITKSDVINFCLPLPDIDNQRAIAAEISAEQAAVNANRELITRFEAKIEAVIDRVWSSE